jgi:hypothetical protein
MNPKSRAHRTLKRLRLYQSIDSENVPTVQLPSLSPDDSWLGIYLNVPGSAENAVAFSMERLHVNVTDRWISVKYADILDTRVDQEKTSASEILLRTSNDTVKVPITGGNGKTRELFEVLRFLNGVQEDLRKRQVGLQPSPG